MKISLWPFFITALLGGCIPKAKYESELVNIEKVYVRIDHMTRGMNQMGSEINRLRDLQSDNKTANERVIKKLRIEKLSATDIQPEIQEMNSAMAAYQVHHAKGGAIREYFSKLKTMANTAVSLDTVSFLADNGNVGFTLTTALFSPENSPKLNDKAEAAFNALVHPLNDFEDHTYTIIAHVDPSMPTGKRYDTVSDLGLWRALNIATGLVEAGVKPSRLSVAVQVAAEEVSKEASKEERAYARRIEIHVFRSLEGNPGFETLDAIERGDLRL